MLFKPRSSLLLPGTLMLALATATTGAAADPGQIQDPTGCATGSAVANCRNLPGNADRDTRAKPRAQDQRGLSNGDRLRQDSPLPSEKLRGQPSTLPPPGSTGLGGGSTGLGD